MGEISTISKGTVYFFTGLAGAGKTTIGERFYSVLHKTIKNVVLLDGDSIRKVYAEDLGYTPEERLKVAQRTFRVCQMLADQGIDVVVCSICMYDSIRDWNRQNIEKYKEIYLKVSRDTLLVRNQKKLYTEGKNVMGVDIPFEEPKTPDVVVENDGIKTPDEIVDELCNRFGIKGV